jgi:ribonuclease J
LQVKQNPAYRDFREAFPNVVDIHTSGHASRECIKKVIDIVKPKEVICIHKEAGAEL